MLGLPKAAVCRDALRDIAPYLDAEAHILAADRHTLPALLQGVDAAVDCLDSVPAKMMLESCAAEAGIPFVHGAVSREEGFAFLADAGERRLLAMYPEGTLSEASPSTSACAAAGTATLMASLAIRRILSPERGPSPLLHLDCSVPELEAFLS